VKLSLINPIGEGVDITELENQLHILRNKPFDIDSLIGENKSGFSKAANILQFDFNNVDNELNYFVNNDGQFQVNLTIDTKNISKW